MKYIKKYEMHIAAIQSMHAISCGFFFQFKITPKVKLYLRKGVASCCHLSFKSCYWFEWELQCSVLVSRVLPWGCGWISESEVTSPRALGPHGVTRLSYFSRHSSVQWAGTHPRHSQAAPVPPTATCFSLPTDGDGHTMVCVLPESHPHHSSAKPDALQSKRAAWGHQKV